MSVNRSELVAVREAVPEDKNFILATWLRGLKYGNDWFDAIDSEVYFKVYHQVIESLLVDPRVKIYVACLKEDPSVILGYSVSSGERLDWVFVKKVWRGIGIARALTPPSIKVASHLTVIGRSILHKHQDIKFNPFSLT